MIEVIAVNKAGQQINLSDNSNYILTSVTGITPPKAVVNTASLATKDGSVFNSSKLGNRNIVLTVFPDGKVEQSRLNLYRVLKSKQYVKLYLTTAARDVWVDGWIESMEANLFDQRQKVQISVICPDPYLKDVSESVTAFSNGSATIDNVSDDEVGFVAQFTASGAVSDIILTNSTTGKSFKLNYDLVNGDKVTLDTRRGEKGISLLRSGSTANLINYIDIDSDWIQLEMGENALAFSCTSGSGNLSGSVTVQPIYEGV